MVPHMKTTIEISDPLFRRAKDIATREGTSLRALVEQGLRQVLQERETTGAFRLRDASFQGEGLAPVLRDASWERIRDLAYGERA